MDFQCGVCDWVCDIFSIESEVKRKRSTQLCKYDRIGVSAPRVADKYRWNFLCYY